MTGRKQLAKKENAGNSTEEGSKLRESFLNVRHTDNE